LKQVSVQIQKREDTVSSDTLFVLGNQIPLIAWSLTFSSKAIGNIIIRALAGATAQLDNHFLLGDR